MGAWQTDPEVQRLAQAVMAANAAPFTGQKLTQLDQATAALQHYIDANRARLGVPDGYSVRGDGQLHKTGYPWWVIPATGAGMALGGLGPLWAVYDADKVPEMAARPVAERFGSCPWALYHIDVT